MLLVLGQRRFGIALGDASSLTGGLVTQADQLVNVSITWYHLVSLLLCTFNSTHLGKRDLLIALIAGFRKKSMYSDTREGRKPGVFMNP